MQKLTILQYLSQLYITDKYISNIDAWMKLREKFPGTKASIPTLLCWKSKLRKSGVDIPYQKLQKKEQ